MKDQLFASGENPPSSAKPVKGKARPKADTKHDSSYPAKELLRENQNVLSHFKKALDELHKAQELAHDLLPKIKNQLVQYCGHAEFSLETASGFKIIDVELLRGTVDKIVNDTSSTEGLLLVWLNACHAAFEQSVKPGSYALQTSLDLMTNWTDVNPQQVMILGEGTREIHILKGAPVAAAARELTTGEKSGAQFELGILSNSNTHVHSETNQELSRGDIKSEQELVTPPSPTTNFLTESIAAAEAPPPALGTQADSARPDAERPAPPEDTTGERASAMATQLVAAAPFAPQAPLADVPLKSPLGLLTLRSIHGVGPQSVEKLIARYPTLRELQETPPYMLKGLVTANIIHTLKDKEQWKKAAHDASRIIDEAEKCQARVVTIWDSEYPIYLKEIPDKPLLLYVKGKLKADCRAVACIGTREPSKFGYEVTRRITSIMVSHKWAIVSGLAIGVDSLAHEAALDGGGYTVAILGNGLDTIYPRKNADLAKDILASGGALISEQPFGTPPVARNLVQRDRLQSGMSLGTIVMQTDIVGGSMHTVRYTLTQGRLLFASVPSGVHRSEPKSQGLLALTENNGPAFAKIMNASGPYATLLESKFADRSPAIPIVGRENYDDLLTQLEQAYQQKLGTC